MANNFFYGKGLLVRFEEKTVSSGKRVASFNVLLSEPRKKDEERKDDGTFINVEAWQLPENVVTFLSDNVKRTQIVFQGRLKQDRWEKDGAKRSAYKIIADADSIKPVPLKKREEAPPPPPKEKVTTEEEVPF